MTTICIDWDTKVLYTDSRVSWERKEAGLLSPKTSKGHYDKFIKLWRTNNVYHFYTGTGTVSYIEKFIRTKNHRHLKDSVVWEIDAEKCRVISHRSSGPTIMSQSSCKRTVNGTGKYCLETALNLTDDIEKAMQAIADPYTGGKIMKYKIDWSYLYEDIQ